MVSALPATSSTWRPDIEGLRGIAVLLVVVFHAGVPAFRGAFVAVDVFFVLSGFFLASVLIRQLVNHDQIRVREVLSRRVWRLLPAMLVVLLITLLSAMLLYAPIDRADVARHLIPVAFFGGNLAFASSGVNYFSAGENPLLHTWTLGVEYQLVVCLTALFAGLSYLGRKRAGTEPAAFERRLIVLRTILVGVSAVGALSWVASAWLNHTASMWAYFGPHTRLWAFVAGAAVAFVAGAGQSVFGASADRISLAQSIGLVAIVVSALLFDRGVPYAGVAALIPVIGTMLLLSGGALAADTPIGRLLSTPPLARLGRLSFGWYLWHWPLIVLGGVLFPSIGPWGKLACALLGLLLAVATDRVVEQPARRWLAPRILDGHPLLYALATCTVMMAIAQGAASRADRLVNTTAHRPFAAAREDRMDHGCWAGRDGRRSGTACTFGAEATPTTFALLGDSHAEHWLGGLDVAGRTNQWRVDVQVMGGCPVADLRGLANHATLRRFSECSRFLETMTARIIANRPRAVLLSNFDAYLRVPGGDEREYQVDERAWTEGLRRTYQRFSHAGIPIVVMRGTPRVPFDVPSCLSRRAERLPFARDCQFVPNLTVAARARRAQDIAARGLDVQFLDVNDVVCPMMPCTTQRGPLVVFTDDNHLTATFSRSVGAVLGQRLAGVLARPKSR
jgi:peptidoglycan/LPS O-acetylase OafA/YrhL